MIKETAEMLKKENKVILVHGNADMDAVGSAYALSVCFPKGDIFAPGGIDRIAGMAAEKLNMKILEDCDISDYDLVVVVDTSSPEQLKPAVQEVPPGSVVIDHHSPTGKWEGMHFYCDNTRVSCCEIIKDIIDWFGLGVRLKKEDEDNIIAEVKVSEQAMHYWSLQYGEHIEILSPEKLRKSVGAVAKAIAAKYEK